MTWAPIKIQKRLFEIFTGDAQLTSLLASPTSIYDFVPQECPYPFISIGEIKSKDRGSHTTDGFDTDLFIDVWDQNTGRKRVHDIMSRIDDLLHNVQWNIEGQREVSLRRSTSNILVDIDSVTYHGIASYKILSMEE